MIRRNAIGSQNVAAPLMVRKSNADRLAEILNIKKESFSDGSSHWVILKFDKHEVEIVFDENSENVTGITLSKSKRKKIISRLK